MRRFALIFVLFISLPLSVQAACSTEGYTIVFVNGIFDTEKDAIEDGKLLQDKLPFEINGQTITVKTGYNQSHVAGAGDLAETYFPALDQFDLDTVLRQIHDEVQTRKLLIVGHSQGAVYANKIYEYLITHGEPKESVAVYAVATPDNYVAGGGKYVTYLGDDVIAPLELVPGLHPLPANLTYTDWINSNGDSPQRGHGFIDEYLNGFSDRIVSDINSELWVLRAGESTTTDGCFDPPKVTVGYQTEKVALAVADPLAVGAKVVGSVGYKIAAAAVVGTYDLASAALGSVISFLHPPTPEQKAANSRAFNDAAFTLVKAVAGSSLTPKQVDELQRGGNPGLGGAAILAFVPEQEATDTVGVVLGTTSEAASTIDAAGSATSSIVVSPEMAPTPSLPEPLPPQAADRISASDGQGGTSSGAPTTPPIPVLVPPQNIVFSNWHSPDDASSINPCSTITRTVDIAWDASPGAESYELWATPTSDQSIFNLLVATTDTHTDNQSFFFGSNWNIPVSIKVVALDGRGGYATTTLSLTDAVPDKIGASISSLSPTYGSTNVPVATPITIAYSEPIDPISITNKFSLFDAGPASGAFVSTPVSIDAALQSDGHTVVMTASSPLLAGERYNLVASCNVKDLYGNYSEPVSIDISHNTVTFTTAP